MKKSISALQAGRHLFAFSAGLGIAVMALSLSAFAKPTQKSGSKYICAAKVNCGVNQLPSTQDLPTIREPLVRADSIETARTACMTEYTNSYKRLAKSLTPTTSLLKSNERSCQIDSEAMPVKNQ